MSDRKLGRGLDFLIKRTSPIPAPVPEPVAPETGFRGEIEVESIQPNPFQPRREFDIEILNDLIDSIRQHGVLQPIAVRRHGAGYQLIAGERRWRACRELGLTSIPARIVDADNQRMLELALVENIQRQDLDPIEKAKAYRRLMTEFAMTQDQAASRLAQKRSTVANALRLLDLPPEVRALISSGKLSAGHGRALAGLSDATEIRSLAERAVDLGSSVREVEALIQARRETQSAPAPTAGPVKSAEPSRAQFAEIEQRVREALGVRVQLKGGARRGRLVLEYQNPAVLQHLLSCFELGAAAINDRYASEGSAG